MKHYVLTVLFAATHELSLYVIIRGLTGMES